MSTIEFADWNRRNVLGYAESVLGLLFVTAGAALFPFPMVGLLGIPAVLLGFPLAIYGLFALSHTGRSNLIGNIAGSLLIVLGMGAILAVSAMHAESVHACILAWKRNLPTDLPSFSSITTWPLIGPTLIVGGIWLRQGEQPREMAALWSTFVMLSLVTILCVIVLAWFVPLAV